ncbi:MAG: hypothetical protein OXN21_06975 [Chloroflexota bacterium]|nr:hypothetical protein [Chloroflexota bacterium]MDE2843108.1 hypothetical protein [Chloroflexota bacterium]
MHLKHMLWIGLPLLGIVIFSALQAWAPGRFSGAIALVIMVAFLAIVFALRFRKTFHD